MSQQRPDRIKQMLHYLWQHRHLSTQQAIELFGYAEATVRRDFHYIASRYELGGFPHVESYIIGGLIRPGYFSVGEILALEMINAFAVERAFISCDALSIETGITNATMFEVGVKTRIIQRSREVILMADHSKFDTVEPHAVATLSCITTILSDSALPSAIARRYQQAGCRLIMSAPSSGAR
ncbi:DeoR/GlpR transcriptional regulator [Salmonella enterica subsp. enterica serovar Muenchen]|nr:DeoR/GlpR transcriptional regulator [Salmonella enterica]ECT9687005.1 DeoR/GlpR transcriptional regulator [Salmonella enterica subsp. enterica serovar Muenchen]